MQKQQLTIKLILLKYLDRFLNPNFETKFVWALLVTGISIVSYQRFWDLMANFEFTSPKLTARLSLSQGTDWWVTALGIGLILMASFFFYRIHFSHKNKEAVFQSLKEAAPTIRQYLDDNRRIFISFGPNSSTASDGSVRMDMEVWEESKQNRICPNNDKIESILNSVQDLDDQEKSIVEKMRNHIEAFKTHCNKPNFCYSNHQFPLGFSDLIYKYCAELDKSRSRISEYSDWLRVQLSFRT